MIKWTRKNEPGNRLFYFIPTMIPKKWCKGLTKPFYFNLVVKWRLFISRIGYQVRTELLKKDPHHTVFQPVPKLLICSEKSLHHTLLNNENKVIINIKVLKLYSSKRLAWVCGDTTDQAGVKRTPQKKELQNKFYKIDVACGLNKAH